MQDRIHAYCPVCGEDDLFRGVGEVAARQGAYHQAVEVDDDHQTCHCLVGEAVSVWHGHYLEAVAACDYPTHLVKGGVVSQAPKIP
ncbi:MAG: hypothetical protein K5764_07415 [Prevotella sp.]|nr:hypothetical protein [Prevotella sp.]